MNYRQEWHQAGPVSVLVEWSAAVVGDPPQVLCTLVQVGSYWIMYDTVHRLHQLANTREATLDVAQHLAEDVLVNECGED